MSEHHSGRRPTRPVPAPVLTALQAHAPGVSYKKGGFDFWLILKLGLGLIVTVVVLQLAVWWLLYRSLRCPTRRRFWASRPWDWTMPAGRSANVCSTCHRRTWRASNARAACSSWHPAKASSRGFTSPRISTSASRTGPLASSGLREGQAVTIAYHVPGEERFGGLGVATSVRIRQ